MVRIRKAEISIEDSGVGIPREQVEQVFQPYFRVCVANYCAWRNFMRVAIGSWNRPRQLGYHRNSRRLPQLERRT